MIYIRVLLSSASTLRRRNRYRESKRNAMTASSWAGHMTYGATDRRRRTRARSQDSMSQSIEDQRNQNQIHHHLNQARSLPTIKKKIGVCQQSPSQKKEIKKQMEKQMKNKQKKERHLNDKVNQNS